MGEQPMIPCLPKGGPSASSLGNSWSVGDYNCCTIYPSSYLFMELIYLEPTSHQTLDQPWDLTSFDGAMEEKDWVAINPYKS